jgi:hypothetical protein
MDVSGQWVEMSARDLVQNITASEAKEAKACNRCNLNVVLCSGSFLKII